jgi:hypothetical protein
MEYLSDPFPGIHRLPPAGSADIGDLGGVPDLTIQVKAHHKMTLAAWITETFGQAVRAGTPFYVVIHKRWGCGRKSVDQWYVTLPLGVFAEIYRRLLFGPPSESSASTIGRPSVGSR